MIVVDVNVVLAALRSSRGASHQILRAMLEGKLQFALSPAIALEYEDVLKRPGILGNSSTLSSSDIDIVLDALLGLANIVSPYFHFHPFLDDPKDDIYIDCALAAGATVIVSSDRHFRHPTVEAFGLSAMRSAEFWQAYTIKRESL